LKRILYVGRYNESENLTGPEKVAKRIFQESSKKTSSVFLEYFFDGKIYGPMKKFFGYEEIEKTGGSKIYRLGILRIPLFLIKQKPEVIHIITFERFAVLCCYYKIVSKVKIIFNVHGVVCYENKEHRKVSGSQYKKDLSAEKKFFKYSDKLLFLSQMPLKIAKNLFDFDERKLEFINNGIDEEFNSVSNKPKNESLSVVFIGDSERKDKDFEFLYNALGKIVTKCTLFIIGNYDKQKYPENSKYVNFKTLPRMDTSELVNFLSDKNIYISSSSYDTFSIAAAECMCAGLAPIVTDTTGISKLIVNGENGFVVTHGHTDELAEKINLLLSDNELRKRISLNASKIYSILSWGEIYKHYEKIYNSL